VGGLDTRESVSVPNIAHKVSSAAWNSGLALGAFSLTAFILGPPATALVETTVKAVVTHDVGFPQMETVIEEAAPVQTTVVLAGVASMVRLVDVSARNLLGEVPLGPRPGSLGSSFALRSELRMPRRSDASSASNRATTSSSAASAPWYITVLVSVIVMIVSAAVSVLIYKNTRRNQVEDQLRQRMEQADRDRLEDTRREQKLLAEQRRNEREDRDAEYQDVNTALREVNTLVAAASRRQVLFTGDFNFESLQNQIDRVVGNSTPADLKSPLDKLAVCVREVQDHVLPTREEFEAQRAQAVTGYDYTGICKRAAELLTAVQELGKVHSEAYEALRKWARVDV